MPIPKAMVATITRAILAQEALLVTLAVPPSVPAW
jgi:hypothetical protein